MQQVKVKDIKSKTGEVKTGARAGQPYELVIIIGEDGSEFTTFDTAIKEVGIGGTLELDAVIKNNKTNITKFTIIEKGSAAPAPGPKTNGKPDMSKDDWAEKDRLERWSRECNTCFMGIPDLLKVEPTERIRESEVYNAALDWAMAHFNGQPAPKAKTEKPKTTADKDFPELFPETTFKNVGEFLTRVTKELGITSTAICEKLGVKDVKEIADYQAAYELLKENPDK